MPKTRDSRTTAMRDRTKTPAGMKSWASALDETEWWAETGKHEWSPNNTIDPHDLTRTSMDIVLVIDPECHHEYERKVRDWVYRGSSCPICHPKKLVRGVNDLQTLCPDIALDFDEEANGCSASDVLAHTHKRVHWCCHICGHKWIGPLYKRTKEGHSCPQCAREVVSRKNSKAVIPGVNDLASQFPLVALDWDEEANGIPATQVLPGSNKKWHFTCHVCGYEWTTTLASRTHGGTGCAHCAGQVIISGVDDLATRYPDLAKEWDEEANGMPASQVHPGASKKAHWRCQTCGHEWDAIVQNRTRGGRGCPLCQHRVVVAGRNDIATTHPWLAQEWHPTLNGDRKPTEFSYGSDFPAYWLGECGHVWRTPIKNRGFFGCGCPFCRTSHYEKEARRTLSALTSQETGLSVEEQWSDDTCRHDALLRFDFVITENGIPLALIEIQGRQHYAPIDFFGGVDSWKKQQERDRIKRQWAHEHGIPLMEIDCYAPTSSESQRKRDLLGFLAVVGVIPPATYFEMVDTE